MAEPVASAGYDDRPLQEPTTQRCPNCSGAAKVPYCPPSFRFGLVSSTVTHVLISDYVHMKLLRVQVMCPTCLCTGMALASEHDPRIDPFV